MPGAQDGVAFVRVLGPVQVVLSSGRILEVPSASQRRLLAVLALHARSSVRAEWLAKAGPLGLEVDVKLGDELVQGRFAGMDREGALLLDTVTGPRRIVAGELLARAA